MSKSKKVLFCICTDGVPPIVFQRKALFDKYKPGPNPSRRKGFKNWESLTGWIAEQKGGNESLVEGLVCPMDVEQNEDGDQERGFVAMRYSEVHLSYEQKFCKTRNEAEDWLASRRNLDGQKRKRDGAETGWSEWLPAFLVENHEADIEKLDASGSGEDAVWTMGYLETFLRQASIIKAVLPGGMVLYVETGQSGNRVYVVSSGFSWDGTPLFESAFFLVPDNKYFHDEVQREALAVACALEDISLQQSGPLCIVVRNHALCQRLSVLSQGFGIRDAGQECGEAVASLLGMVAASGKDVRMVYLDEVDDKASRVHEILQGILPEQPKKSFLERLLDMLPGRSGRKESLAVRLDRDAIAQWNHPGSLCVRRGRLLFAICMPEPLTAYTDASFHDGKAGCSASVYWQKQMVFRVDLAFSAGWLTSSKAELIAILNLVLHVRDGSALKIYTDYRDVTQERDPGTFGPDGDVTDYLALRDITQRILSVAGVEIAWVKGHAGNARNQEADQQARNNRNELV